MIRNKKSFQLGVGALLPILAHARGSENGLDWPNAITTVLIDNTDVKLQLHHYNKRSDEDSSIFELRGDLELELKTAAPYYQEFGFCFGKVTGIGTATTEWDCMRVHTLADPDVFNSSDE